MKEAKARFEGVLKEELFPLFRTAGFARSRNSFGRVVSQSYQRIVIERDEISCTPRAIFPISSKRHRMNGRSRRAR
jgi:hypothetical protein